MATKIDKYQEMVEKLKREGDEISINQEDYERSMKKMNESVEKTRQEYLVKDSNSQIQAATVIVR